MVSYRDVGDEQLNVSPTTQLPYFQWIARSVLFLRSDLELELSPDPRSDDEAGREQEQKEARVRDCDCELLMRERDCLFAARSFFDSFICP